MMKVHSVQLPLASNAFNPIRPGGRGGGAESARANFNLRELPCYLSNIYKILPLLPKFIGEQVVLKNVCPGYGLLPWQPDFQSHV